MPLGILINCGAVATGGLLGQLTKLVLPQRICDFLSKLFGITSIVVGVSLIQKSDALSPVLLSLILGAILGEAIHLEELLQKIPFYISQVAGSSAPGVKDNSYIERFTAVLVLICSGSLGLMGAMTEGMTGDPGILITKSILDLFGAAVFASTLGSSVSLIAIPQFLLYLLLYLLAKWIMPLVNPQMIADFMCCGGVIALVTGIRVAEIKAIRVSSLLPALVLVMPISLLWQQIL